MTHPLTLITFIPLVGMVLILLCPQTLKGAYKWIAAAATFAQLLIAGWLYANFNTSTAAIQFVERNPWIRAYHVFFLIGIWGGPRREYAAIKLFLYTLLGSVLILLVMLGLYFYGAAPTFDMTQL